MRKRNPYGFTLAELLVVVAIIGVLVGISIPIFSSQLEKAREATDLANVRAAYAEVMSDVITENISSSLYDPKTKRYSKSVKLKQKQIGWVTTNLNVAGITPADTTHWVGQVLPGNDCTVFYDADKGSTTLLWSGLTVKNDYQWKQVNGKLVLSNVSVVSGWVAGSIPNAFDKTINSGETFTVESLSNTLKNATENGKYQFELGYFITKADGTIIVDSGYIVLGEQERTLNITTNEQTLIDQGSNAYSVKKDIDVQENEDCKVCIQLFKVKLENGTRTGSIKLTEEEDRALSDLIKIQ